ncbi:uncharacterized protein LOC117142390 [Drosophila mauritiana]|uniref:Uncharacterized protein LOC117142390 n=1 Tax=Drosophila mauritiana TaxID=7226 RepID=A0A6P8K0T9_DROMA|nr:uncharacterized protein LOC117142390 [Drosophila mauritiana]
MDFDHAIGYQCETRKLRLLVKFFSPDLLQQDFGEADKTKRVIADRTKRLLDFRTAFKGDVENNRISEIESQAIPKVLVMSLPSSNLRKESFSESESASKYQDHFSTIFLI